MLNYLSICDHQGGSISAWRGLMPNIKADGPLAGYPLRTPEILWEVSVMDALKLIAQDSLKADVSEAIKVGNTIKIWVKIREGERERLQAFEGTVIAVKGSGVSQTFTVRRVSYGVGVERVFPVHSPNVDKIELIRTGKVRRSKLYYLRDRVGKAAKVKQSIG